LWPLFKERTKGSKTQIESLILKIITWGIFLIVLTACTSIPAPTSQPILVQSVVIPKKVPVLEGKPHVLVFWAGLCGWCKKALPEAQKFYEESDVLVVGVDIGQEMNMGSKDDAKRMIRKLGLTFPMKNDVTRQYLIDHKIYGVPTFMFVNSDGSVYMKLGSMLAKRQIAGLAAKLE